MKIEYDKSVNAIYISFKDILAGEAVHTYPCNPLEVDGQINLDFDKDFKLIGIEILEASKKVPQEILDEADIIG